MHRPAGQLNQANVARNQQRFGAGRDGGQAESGCKLPFGGDPISCQRRIFGMLDNARAKTTSVGKGGAHHPGGGDGAAAIGEGDGAGFPQQAKLGQFLATAAACHGAVGQDGQAAGFLAARAQQADQSRVVDRRHRVGQGGEGRDAAGSGGLGSRMDSFAVFKPRLAQCGAQVDQAGAEYGSLGGNCFDIVGAAQCGAKIDDAAVAHQQAATQIGP